MVNIAELLKGATKGTKLYSPLFGEVKLVRVDKRRGYPIDVLDCNGNGKSFTEFGVYFANHPDAECLLFPSKECRTWEGWTPCVETNFKVGDWVVRKDGETFYGGNYAEQITLIEVDEKGKCIWLSSTSWVNDDAIRLWTISDAKDGDVLATDNGWTCIFQAFDGCVFSSYCFMDSQKWFCELGSEVHTPDSRINGNIHPATKEQRDLFFKRMQEVGYQWYAGKKELRKIIEPKFNVLDWIVRNDGSSIVPIQVYGLKKDRYLVTNMLGSKGQVMINRQDEWRLWTIQDAKDGDVLVCYSEVKGSPIEQAGIFKQYVGRHGGCSNAFLAHTGIDWDGNIIINGYMGSTDIIPATKEQHELLFQKIKESGYQWDTDKKELRKIIKPDFKVGDWIVRGEGFVYEPSLITEIRDYYICELLNGERVTYTLNDVHKNFHLWTIQDAKDGDVLAVDWHQDDDSWEKIVIFKKYHAKGVKGLLNSPCVEGYGNTFKNGKLVLQEEVSYYSKTWTMTLQPATKEQRDLLFAKMKEKGCQWDADKKEPRKINPHYDIANFHAGMPVLVREYDTCHWQWVQYSHFNGVGLFFAAGKTWRQCIPFNEDTKHLLGTTDLPSEEYINW